MTSEQLQQICEQWLSPRLERSTCTAEDLGRAIGDIALLLAEVERLRKCCDEITRQYARLCYSSAAVKAVDETDPQQPRAPAA